MEGQEHSEYESEEGLENEDDLFGGLEKENASGNDMFD